jgi:membrane protein DedA with SNARE-associated domain
MDAVFHWIVAYGPGMLFLLLMLGVVGLPIPEETILVYCGYLIGKGELKPVVTFFSALFGSWCGISLSYTIGRTAGIGVVHRFGKYLHISEKQLDGVHQWFDRIGHWALFVGYYIAGVRHFTAIVAGTSGLSFPVFAKFAWPGGLLWVSTFLTLGYFIGENWKAIAEAIHQYVLYASIALLVGVLCVYLWRRNYRPGSKAGPTA